MSYFCEDTLGAIVFVPYVHVNFGSGDPRALQYSLTLAPFFAAAFLVSGVFTITGSTVGYRYQKKSCVYKIETKTLFRNIFSFKNQSLYLVTTCLSLWKDTLFWKKLCPLDYPIYDEIVLNTYWCDKLHSISNSLHGRVIQMRYPYRESQRLFIVAGPRDIDTDVFTRIDTGEKLEALKWSTKVSNFYFVPNWLIISFGVLRMKSTQNHSNA